LVRLSSPDRRSQKRPVAAPAFSRREIWRLFSLLLGVAMVGFLIREFNRPQVAAQVDRAMAIAVERATSDGVPDKPRDSQPADPAQFRKLLELAGWDSKRLDSLAKNSELTDSDRNELVQLLWRLKTFDGPQLGAWARAGKPFSDVAADPKAHLGELIRLNGHVTKAESRELPAELAERLEIPNYYQCEMALDGNAGIATILTGRIPQVWLEMPTLHEPATADGVFIKLLAPVAGTKNGLFVSSDVAWKPTQPQPPFVSFGESVLGGLGVDVGLLDGLRQRRPLSRQESEAFYQMLAAMGNIGVNQLDRFANRDLVTVQEHWAAEEKRITQLLQKDPAAATTRERAQLQLAREVQSRAANGLFSVAPLFNQPNEHVGELLSLEGTVRRATRIDVGKSTDGGESDVARRFGIDHYYELDVFTDDSQNNPVVFCVRELPAGFPLGDGLGELVRIAGFFLKSWSFESRRATLPTTPEGTPTPAGMRQFAPLLVGRGPIILEKAAPATFAYASYVAASLFLLLLAAVWATGWWFARDERRLKGATLADRFALPEGESLNDLHLDLSPAAPKNE
jgi:hypothetical protein